MLCWMRHRISLCALSFFIDFLLLLSAVKNLLFWLTGALDSAVRPAVLQAPWQIVLLAPLQIHAFLVSLEGHSRYVIQFSWTAPQGLSRFTVFPSALKCNYFVSCEALLLFSSAFFLSLESLFLFFLKASASFFERQLFVSLEGLLLCLLKASSGVT